MDAAVGEFALSNLRVTASPSRSVAMTVALDPDAAPLWVVGVAGAVAGPRLLSAPVVALPWFPPDDATTMRRTISAAATPLAMY